MRRIGLVTLALLALAAGIPSVTARSPTAEQVTVCEVRFRPPAACPGAAVTLEVWVQDRFQETATVEAVLQAPGTGRNRPTVPLQYHNGTGAWTAVVTIPAHAPPGRWQVWELCLSSDDGTQAVYRGGRDFSAALDVGALPRPASLRVEAVRARCEAAGEQRLVTVEGDITDPAGIEWVEAVIVGPSGQELTMLARVTADPEHGFPAVVPIPLRLALPRGVEGGTWQLGRITVRNGLGETGHFHAGPDFTAYFQVDSPYHDTSPPTVSQVAVTPNPVQAGQALTVRAELGDDYAGVEFARAWLAGPEPGQRLDVWLQPVHGSTWEGGLQLPAHLPAGTWNLTVQAMDRVGNQSSRSTVHAQVAVEPTDGPIQRPVLRELSLSASEEKSALEVMAVLADGELELRQVLAQLRSPSGRLVLTLDLVPAGEGRWVRALQLPVLEAGSWQLLSLLSVDLAGVKTILRPGHDFVPGQRLAVEAVVAASGPQDDAPPVLLALEVLTTNLQRGQRVVLRAEVADEGLGVESVWALVEHWPRVGSGRPADNAHRQVSFRFDPASGSWEGSVLLPTDAVRGPWVVSAVRVQDRAFNTALYRYEEDYTCPPLTVR